MSSGNRCCNVNKRLMLGMASDLVTHHQASSYLSQDYPILETVGHSGNFNAVQQVPPHIFQHLMGIDVHVINFP